MRGRFAGPLVVVMAGPIAPARQPRIGTRIARSPVSAGPRRSQVFRLRRRGPVRTETGGHGPVGEIRVRTPFISSSVMKVEAGRDAR
ncbi:hypothetical protein AB4084_33845, partial [Lysobacter sp. 2RAB21]